MLQGLSIHLDSRQTLSQREKELLDSADKCRETMENQMTDLRKQCSSLEQEITSAREDNKSLQQQLRDKVDTTCSHPKLTLIHRVALGLCFQISFVFLALQESELLALAKSVGREKTALDNVVHQLEEARELADQRQSQLEAMQGTSLSKIFIHAIRCTLIKQIKLTRTFLTLGNHQLEVAQLSIKLREVTAELEEVHFACSQHHMIPGSGAFSDGGSSKPDTTPEEHIYEEPPEEVHICTCNLIVVDTRLVLYQCNAH